MATPAMAVFRATPAMAVFRATPAMEVFRDTPAMAVYRGAQLNGIPSKLYCRRATWKPGIGAKNVFQKNLFQIC